MRLFTLVLLLVAAFAVIRFIAWLSAAMSGGRYRAYRHLAARYGGRYESRGLVDPPTVSFGHGLATVRVGLAPVVAGQPNPPRTRVVVRFAEGSPFRLELFPALRPAPPQPARGTRLLKLGEPSFDRDYIVRANDPGVLRSFLGNPDVREGLETLRSLAPPAGLLLTTNPERLLVQIDRDLGNSPKTLEIAVQWVLFLYDEMTEAVELGAAEGIEIVDTAAASAEEVGPPLCKVCGEPILGHHVRCSTCKTPHHQDCWEFVGGCSIYGCKGRQAHPQSVSGR